MSSPQSWLSKLWARDSGPEAAPGRAIQAVDKLADRYLDPRKRFEVRHDEARKALTEKSPEAARRWQRRLALHRALVGHRPRAGGLKDQEDHESQENPQSPKDRTTHEPSGFEDGRGFALVMARLEKPRTRRIWLVAPAFAMAALAILMVIQNTPSPSDDSWIARRGIDVSHTQLRVGLGIGGINEAGSEYEILASNGIREGDWLRLSYTNERDDLGWLFVVALRGDAIVWLTPLPSDGQSLAIGRADRTPLPDESRLPESDSDRFVVLGLFTAEPLTVDAMRAALEALPSGFVARLDSGSNELEPHLRAHLTLAPTDIVQVIDARIARTEPQAPAHPGASDALDHTGPSGPSGPKQEAP